MVKADNINGEATDNSIYGTGLTRREACSIMGSLTLFNSSVVVHDLS